MIVAPLIPVALSIRSVAGVGDGRIGNGWEDERGKYWGKIDVGGEELHSRYLEWGWALGKRRGLFVVGVGMGMGTASPWARAALWAPCGPISHRQSLSRGNMLLWITASLMVDFPVMIMSCADLPTDSHWPPPRPWMRQRTRYIRVRTRGSAICLIADSF